MNCPQFPLLFQLHIKSHIALHCLFPFPKYTCIGSSTAVFSVLPTIVDYGTVFLNVCSSKYMQMLWQYLLRYDNWSKCALSWLLFFWGQLHFWGHPLTPAQCSPMVGFIRSVSPQTFMWFILSTPSIINHPILFLQAVFQLIFQLLTMNRPLLKWSLTKFKYINISKYEHNDIFTSV